MTLALHMHRDISILGVCAWVWSSIISVDESVVGWYFGRCPINDSRFKAKAKKKKEKRNINNVCWAG